MNSKKVKPIIIHIETKERLDKAKEVDYETYDSVIRRALKALMESSKESKSTV